MIGRPPSYTPRRLPITLGSCGTTVSVNDSAEVAGVNKCGGSTPFPYAYLDGSVARAKVWINDGYELNDKGDIAGQLGETGAPSDEVGIEFASGTLEHLPPLHAGDLVTVKALNDSDLAVGYEQNPRAGATPARAPDTRPSHGSTARRSQSPPSSPGASTAP